MIAKLLLFTFILNKGILASDDNGGQACTQEYNPVKLMIIL